MTPVHAATKYGNAEAINLFVPYSISTGNSAVVWNYVDEVNILLFLTAFSILTLTLQNDDLTEAKHGVAYCCSTRRYFYCTVDFGSVLRSFKELAKQCNYFSIYLC